MSPDDNRQLGHLTEQFRHDDAPRTPDRVPAQYAADDRPTASGGVSRPRSLRRPAAWLVLLAAACALSFGIALAQGLLIAAGLVLAGLSGHLFDPGADPARGGPRRRMPPVSR